MHPEVLIIGGGVIGLSIARELHKQGVKRITILEKSVCGQEASWAAAGMLSPQVEADEPDAFFELCCASRDLYPAFADALLDDTGINIELDRTGTLYLAFTDDDILKIHTRVKWQHKAGLAVECLSAVDMTRAEPSVSQNTREALFFPNDWQVENRQLIAALKRYAEINGVEIRENTHVERLMVESGQVIGAETNVGPIAANITVLATGAWTSFIKLGDVEMPVKIEPVRGQIVAFHARETIFRHVVCCSAGYLVPKMRRQILAGSTMEKTGFDKRVTDSAAIGLREMACECVPALSGLEIADQWAGLRPFASDGLPILGSVGDLGGLFIATAHYRNGILLAPLTAKLVADKLVQDLDSEYFTAFGADRFRPRGVGSGS